MTGLIRAQTMFPAFSFVLDRDISEDLALLYPELYKARRRRARCSLMPAQELTKGRQLSYKTFFSLVLIAVYQGGAIMLLSLILCVHAPLRHV